MPDRECFVDESELNAHEVERFLAPRSQIISIGITKLQAVHFPETPRKKTDTVAKTALDIIGRNGFGR